MTATSPRTQAQSHTTTAKEVIALDAQWGAQTFRPLDIVVERAEGAWIYDIDGKRYLDCLGSFSAVNQGHCHPRILATLQEQAHRVTLASRAFYNEQFPFFCETLAKLCGMEVVLAMNTGAEAAETAVKIARRWGYETKKIPDGQAEIIVFDQNFHGRTTTLVGMSSEPAYKAGFGPFTPGFPRVPYNDLEAFRAAITPNTCAIMIEPIQGEAGVRIPAPGYLRAVADLCHEHNILFIADEIQVGLGRTGRMFACDHEGVKPDMYVLGKSLSGGFYPVSAVVSTHAIMDRLGPGSHGSTFGGNPLACAVARTALSVLQDEQLVERSAKLGAWLLDAVRGISHPNIVDVRGRGLMIGIELNVPARPFCEALVKRGLLCKDTHGTIIRLSPPLVIGESDLAWAVDQLRAVFSA